MAWEFHASGAGPLESKLAQSPSHDLGGSFPGGGERVGLSPLGHEHTSPRAEEGNAGGQPERGGHSPWNVSSAVFAGSSLKG